MSSSSEKYRVLLIEDNAGDARLVKEYLREDTLESFSLDHVTDMHSALEYLRHESPQVALLDLGLPDSKGMNSLERLYQHHPNLAIVVLTGLDQEELGVHAVKDGAQDYLSKNAIDGRLLVRSLHFAIQRKANEERMRELLRHDLLTELPNRRALREELSARIHSSSEDSSIGVIFINLDQFKLLNENYGHRTADEVLKLLGQRLRESFRETDFVARVERDEYVVLTRVPTKTQVSALGAAAEKTLQLVSSNLQIPSGKSDLTLNITASVGIASYTPGTEPQPNNLTDRLISNAETAMQKSKRAGGNHCHFFDEQLNAEARHRMKIASGLQNALKNNEFNLNYQPIYDIKNHRLFGVEVLLRWHPSASESIPPDEFIPVLEESFQIVSVGEWVVEQACAQYRSWVEEGILDPETRLFINFSPRQFVDANLYDLTLQTMERYRIPRGILHYEITENLLLSSVEAVLKQLQDLKELGVCIAIDDFGSGFSSMNYLKDMPCDFLKIDRSFICQLESSERNRVITSAIIHLGESLGVGVIAEGVETTECKEQLLDWFCYLQQGYFHARPMNREAFEAWKDESRIVGKSGAAG